MLRQPVVIRDIRLSVEKPLCYRAWLKECEFLGECGDISHLNALLLPCSGLQIAQSDIPHLPPSQRAWLERYPASYIYSEQFS